MKACDVGTEIYGFQNNVLRNATFCVVYHYFDSFDDKISANLYTNQEHYQAVGLKASSALARLS